MASSVARMPADEWRGPSRVGVFGAHIHLKKVHVREPPRSQPHSSDEPETPASRRRTQILDRWAARQAREMVTTIERQAHTTELSELSTTSQTVSTRAATFLRESSPVQSESSSSVGSNSVAGTNDLPPQNVRASSLIQMWRELEAEAGVLRTPRTVSGTTASSLANASDDSEASGDSESEATVTSSSVTDNEKGQVGSIVRMLSIKGRTQSSAEANDSASLPMAPVDHIEGFRLPTGNLVRLRTRRDIEELYERMRKERQIEIEALAERHVVSRFSHRGRIQSVLKLRFLRRESAVQDHTRPSKKRGADHSQNKSSILLLRERFDNATQHSGNEAQIAPSARNGCVECPLTSQGSMHSGNQCQELVSTEDQESALPEMNLLRSTSEDMSELNSPNSRAEDIPELNSMNTRSADTPELNSPDSKDTPEVNSPRSRIEDLQEIQNADGSWDERSMWASNLDWQRSVGSSPLQGWQGETTTEEIEVYTRPHSADIGHIWIGSCSPSWRGWGLDGQDYHDFLESFSDNSEIRDLLERRRVSTSLASDFCGKMNQIMLTFLNRQEQLHDENYSEEYEEQPIWRQNYGFNNADQIASGSSLVPSSYQSAHYPDSWQYTSFTHNPSANLQEPESVHDLRIEMAQMREEISQLRKMVESCLEWQAKLQHSIKDEVTQAVRESVTVANTSDRAICCMCYKVNIDTLLYRCGHMCTCFECAAELQRSTGKCPICQSLIADVVRTYPNY